MNGNTLETGKTIKTLAMVGLMAAVLCMIGPISILLPGMLVPLSLTSLCLYLLVYVLGWKKSLVSYGIYYLLGLAGLPVFSHYSGGVGKAFGPTGGYLLGFALMIFVTGLLIEQFPGWRLVHGFSMLLGTICAYGVGTIWLMYFNHLDVRMGMLMGVIPFLPGDILKMIVAVILGPVLRKRIRPILLS